MTVFSFQGFRKRSSLQGVRHGASAFFLRLASFDLPRLIHQRPPQADNDPPAVLIFRCQNFEEFDACLRFAVARQISWSIISAKEVFASDIDAAPMSLRQLEIEIDFVSHLLIVTEF